jgi:hypothetical protein
VERKLSKENSELQQIRLQENKLSLLCEKKIIGKSARLQQIRLQKDSQEQRLFLKTTYKR